ncbi:MAG: ATP-binding protein, partial [Colwellia sp.]|nr:ATP-binding protein [Colwellia sp.]
LLAPLSKEFTLLSQQAGLQFTYVKSTCVVETDQRLLRRIVQNFLSNAVNYCPQKNSHGKVLLGVKHKQNQLVIEVWDNGPGIDSADQQTIFKEFERLKQTQDKSGLGLGLAICERIAKLLNVDIAVKSTLGQGTCFSITLPRSTVRLAPTSTIESSSQNQTASEFIGLPILLVDNEAIMLKAIQSQLQEWGCNVLAVKDEKSLTSSLAEQDFTPMIIISDYHLDNDENGVDLIQRALSNQAWQVPCIICSADPSEQVREHTSSAQFYFMRKPIKALALKKLMKQLLRDS